MGTEFTYEVFYSKHKVGPWIRHHDFRLTDEVVDMLRGGVAPQGSVPYQVYGDNSYVVDGLDTDTTYYVYVSCTDKYHQWWYSYEGQSSLGGGQSQPQITPSPDDGNTLGFQMRVTVDAFPFGYGPFGSGEFGGS
jgi:hypothetical protein